MIGKIVVVGSAWASRVRPRALARAGREARALRQEREFLPDVLELEVTPPEFGSRLALRLIVALCVLALCWAYLGQVDIVATAPGKIVPNGKLHAVQSVDGGSVKQIFVKEGQRVKLGDPIVEIDSTINKTDLSTLSQRMTMLRAEKLRLSAELADARPNYDAASIPAEVGVLQESIRLSRQAVFESKLTAARNAMKSKTLNIAVMQDGLAKLLASLTTAREKEQRVRPYVGKVVPLFDYLKLKDDAIQLESNVASQRNLLKIAQEEEQAASQEVRRLTQERRSQVLAELDECNSKLTSMNGDVDKAGSLVSRKRIYAPASGVVQMIAVRSDGDFVGPGQTVAKIVPEGRPTTIEAYLSNEDIGFVAVGQPVEIKVDTFPFQRYGSLSGRVASISPDADYINVDGAESRAQEAGESVVPTKAGLKYRLQIRIDGKQPGASDTLLRYQSGMSVQVDVKTDRRRIIHFLFDPLSRDIGSGFNAR